MKFAALGAVVAVVIASLTLTSAALAAPPASGNARPWTVIPKPISYGFVGAAQVGPVSACTSNSSTGGGADLCVDAIRRYVPMYRRVGSTKWKLDRIQSMTGTILFTAPYGRGWQWVWAPRVGFGVMRAHDLYDYAPTS